ncbi:MAG: hypothetical protein LQ341_005076 [Variospora aurantia]|nr:MAG: hypothetical protein LQ341_005076 [Variospora aurantia]
MNDQNKKYSVSEAIKGVLVVGFQMVEAQDVNTIANKLRDEFDLDHEVVEYGPIKKSDPTDSRPDRGKVYGEGFASGQVPTMWVEEDQVPLTLSKKE